MAEPRPLAPTSVASHYGAPVPVDRCGACGGIWFDDLELYLTGVSELLSATAVMADQAPRRQAPACPRCQVPLHRVPPYGMPEDLRIFECAACGGAWLRPDDLVKFGAFRQRRAARRAQGARPRALLVALAVLGLALFAAPAGAKEFVFSRVAIEATVRPDGSMGIVEARTYAFDGRFSWATYRLPLRGTTGLRSIAVSDERGAYRRSGDPRPGTYRVTRDGDAVVIRWNFAAENESRTFVISYIAADVVAVYDDVAELYWQFIGTGWDRPSEDVRVTVRLPGQVRADRIRAWGHGPLHGEARPMDGGAVLTVRGLPGSTMVEGRIVFPREAVPQVRVRRAGAALPRILKEEGDWAARANRERLAQRLLVGAFLAIPLLGLLGWIALYLRYGREPEPAVPEGYTRELPADYTPAELGALWRFGAVQPADFVATVLDLVRRGHLSLATEPSDASDNRGSYAIVQTGQVGGLRAFEREALEILFGRVGATGEAVAINRRRGLPDAVKTRVGQRFKGWTRLVARAAEVHRFFDPASRTASRVTLVLGLAMIIGGVWAGIRAAGALQSLPLAVGGLGTAVVGVICALGSGAIRRRSQRGADDLRRWQGFRRFLLDFSEMREAEPPSLVLWEHFLVYAVPLGVADRVIAQLRALFPAEELARSSVLQPWTTTSSGRGARPALTLSGFTAAFAAAASPSSSGSGGGGGFSGGGGGGGGGSGGRAG